MTNTTRATLVSEPGLFDTLGYPESIMQVEQFARTPGLENSETQAALAEIIEARDFGSHLSRRNMISAIKRLFGLLRPEKIGEEPVLTEVLSLEVHVPKIKGARGTITTVRRQTEGLRFNVSLVGTGGGTISKVSFSESDRLVALGCTRKSYYSVAVWDIMEITDGPDRGRRFAKLARVDPQISKVQTGVARPENCGRRIDEPHIGEHTEFDLRGGSVSVEELTLEIGITDAWHVEAGIDLPRFGITACLKSEVERSRAIGISYRLPGDCTYIAFRETGNPVWYWS